METILLFILLFVLAVILVILLIYLKKPRKEEVSRQLDLLKEEIFNNLNQTQTNHLNSFNSIFSQLAKLYEKMGGLDKESKEIHNLTKTFQNILIPTKKRGTLGENLVENLLREVLPDETILSQYTFRDGKRVDFAIKLPNALVPIDAKFSLDTFRNYVEAGQGEKKQKRKVCIESIKKRILETSQYIYPDEGTVDFSLMYVPSESVYYFIITDTILLDFARSKNVFITGPNSLYIYLKTLCIGFKALKIEKSAKQIYDTLGRLEKDVGSFIKDYRVLGTHLRSASLKYQELDQKIESVSMQLKTIENQKDEV
ncbi:MAG: DNA recombination protein RmuC [Candidatus Omnitrophica bacterium]|nr:DNA recombination protein RmuC [Candidatus Omnitrophota bacterium]MCF7894719.1 DNA recombination protein RmuC [Candidatus Omnitrophota bacterium]